MKTLRNTTRLATLILLVVSLFALASCFGGSLTMQSMTLDPTSVKTVYIVGEELDLSGMKVTVAYNDETLNKEYTYDELTVDVPADATATTGTKTVTVSFADPNLNGKVQSITFQIYVNPDPNATKPDEDVKQEIVLFEKPDTLIDYFASNTDEGKVAYGEPGFLGQYVNTKEYYTVGDDNVFKFLPDVKVLIDGIPANITSFFADVTVSVKGEEGYETLLAIADPINVNTVKYYLGTEAEENLIVSVDTYKGEYQFTPMAVGKVVKIGVLPNADKYEYNAETFTTVTLEAEIIDAYNVYTADELSVLDNTDEDHIDVDNSAAAVNWNTFKLSKGFAGITVSGVVLHCDIVLTADNVPAEFFYVSTTDTYYTNSVTNETIPVPAGTKFLKDWAELYIRRHDGTFLFEGNFFTVDLSAFPIVASPSIFGSDSGKDYGDDFSNSTFMVFDNTADNGMEAPEVFQNSTVQNVSLIGNASRDALKDADGNLARAGGLIFTKSRNFTTLTCKNILSHSFFITYFLESKSEMVIDYIKCYDSYQNAAMIWGGATATLSNSYLSGAGGPLAILADDQLSATTTDVPSLTVVNTVTDSALTGEEIWFSAVGATMIVGQIKAMDKPFKNLGLGTLLDDKGNLGILGVLMASGSSADAALQNGLTQGTLKFNDSGIDRYVTNEGWYNVLNHPAYAQGAPFVSVVDDEGNVHTLFLMLMGEDFVLCNLDMTPFDPTAQSATYEAFQNADAITLSLGGLSIVFDFHH